MLTLFFALYEANFTILVRLESSETDTLSSTDHSIWLIKSIKNAKVLKYETKKHLFYFIFIHD